LFLFKYILEMTNKIGKKAQTDFLQSSLYIYIHIYEKIAMHQRARGEFRLL